MSELESSKNLIGDHKVNIHDFADVSPKAEIGKGVYVGSGAVIGPNVIIGPNTWIGPNVIIEGRVKIGSNNRIFPGACIGLEPQDLKYEGDLTDVLIGDNNTFREARREERTNWKGRGDINSFSRKYTGSYKEKEKEKKKIYEYKEDDFTSL